MTSEPVALRFRQSTLLGIGASIGLGAAIGLLCWAAHIPSPVESPLVAGTAGLPAAIELTLQSRRRDLSADAARIRQGDLRRPIGLVVTLLAVGLSLAVSVVYAILSTVSDYMNGPCCEEGTVANAILVFGTVLIFVVLPFPFGWYASHYLGKHPYRWTSVAVGCAALYSLLMVDFKVDPDTSLLGNFYLVLTLAVIGLAVCVAGASYGKKQQAQFLAKKLARVERRAAREAAKQNSAPKLVTLVGRPNDSPSAPDNHPIRNPFAEIEKLAHLRKIGALTEEEFQAKKIEILGRI